MFKDGMILPDLTLKVLFEEVSQQSLPYILFSEADKDVHALVRDNLVRGPSIIFHRHHKTGCTRIRERQYGVESKVCRHILGVDANSLYLKCMVGDNSTRYYIVHCRGNNYMAEESQQISRAATEWFRFRAITDNVNILHQYNHGEVSIGAEKVRVDGLVPKLDRVCQFHGCYWQGHLCHQNKTKLSTGKGRKMMVERCARTLKTTMYLQLIGYSVIEEYKCRWNNIKKSNTEAQRTKQL